MVFPAQKKDKYCILSLSIHLFILGDGDSGWDKSGAFLRGSEQSFPKRRATKGRATGQRLMRSKPGTEWLEQRLSTKALRKQGAAGAAWGQGGGQKEVKGV